MPKIITNRMCAVIGKITIRERINKLINWRIYRQIELERESVKRIKQLKGLVVT